MKKTFQGLLFILFAAFVAVNVVSCDKNECDTENVSYKDDIKPILSNNSCLNSGCHNAASGQSYEDYAGLKVQVDAGRLIGAVKQSAGFSAMPKSGDKLDDCEISTLEAWVSQGAKNN